MESKVQWKLVRLATQLYPQNTGLHGLPGWNICVNCDIFAQTPLDVMQVRMWMCRLSSGGARSCGRVCLRLRLADCLCRPACMLIHQLYRSYLHFPVSGKAKVPDFMRAEKLSENVGVGHASARHGTTLANTRTIPNHGWLWGVVFQRSDERAGKHSDSSLCQTVPHRKEERVGVLSFRQTTCQLCQLRVWICKLSDCPHPSPGDSAVN